MAIVPHLLYRSDGSPIQGLASSEWETFLEKYPDVPKEELTQIRDTVNEPVFSLDSFDMVAAMRNYRKAFEKKMGKHALLAAPLFMLLSVHVKLKPTSQRRNPFSVYGEITSHTKDYIYNREFQDAEKFGSDGVNLTLNGPSQSCLADDVYYIFESRKLSMKLYDETQRILVDGCIDLVHSQNEFEEVKCSDFQIGECLLTFKYVSIPMAICGGLELVIFNKRFLGKDVTLHDSVHVCGKVVVTYKNTVGNYNSEEIVLFDKNADEGEYEKVVIGSDNNLFSSRRCWVAVPAYSLLHVHIDLFEFETKRKIVKEDAELSPEFDYGVSKRMCAAASEFLVRMSASWFDPSSLRDFQGDDESGQGQLEDGGVEVVQIPRILKSDAPVQQFPAFEVFSVLICHNKGTPLKIHGLLQFSFDVTLDFYNRRINIFKKDKEDPLSLSGRSNTVPVLEGSRLYNTCYPLAVICDLKGTLDEFSIKGIQTSDCDQFLPREGQLCSIFRGDHGFAAVHYAIFPLAAQANLKVFYKEKGLKCGNIPVSGSFCAQYIDFDYPSAYEKKCYRIVFFKNEDPVLVEPNGLIPLSRSSFVVPKNSFFRFDVDLMIGTRGFSVQRTFEIGIIKTSIKMGECEVEIDLEWK